MTKLTLKNNLSLETQAKLFKTMGRIAAPVRKTAVLKGLPQETEEPQEKQAYLDKIITVQKWFEATFPKAFNLKDPKPLKRRIENDIIPIGIEHFTKNQIRQALTAYTNRKAYLEAILESEWRYDLSGAQIEEISQSQKDHIQQKLTQKKQPKKAKSSAKKPVKE